MKIGIITYHRPINYGAILQTVALYKKLKELNDETLIIDYRNSVQEAALNNTHFTKASGIKNKVKALLFFKNNKIKEKKFNDFLCRNVKLSKVYTKENIINANDEFDLFITGSDQVWNLNLNGEDYNYLLNFVNDDNKKISISSSFGYSNIPDNFVTNTIKNLSKYKYISVREQKGKELIEQSLSKKVDVLLDPTLLLEGNEWLNLAKPVKFRLPSKYILFYAVSPTIDDIKAARKLASKVNMKVVVINYNMRYIKGMINCFNIGPEEFLWLFSNASYVVTNSFHGTAFSINLNKEFFVRLSIKQNNGNSRIENILNIVNLKDRYVENIDNYNNVNWEDVNKRLKKERQRCIKIIKKYIDME